MRLTIKLYRVSCSKPEKIKEGIPYEALLNDPDFLLDRSLSSKPGEMKIIKEVEIEALIFEGIFYGWLLSKSKKGFHKWLERGRYIKDKDTALLWVRKGPGKGKLALLDKEERANLSVTASLRYCGDGEFRYSGV